MSRFHGAVNVSGRANAQVCHIRTETRMTDRGGAASRPLRRSVTMDVYATRPYLVSTSHPEARPMTIKVAINGYGRIGRNILRSLYEAKKNGQDIQIVAINDLGDANTNAHLTQYDTAHGRFPGHVSVDGGDLT